LKYKVLLIIKIKTMKTHPFSQSIMRVAAVTLLLLLIPLMAMQLSDEVNWSVADFGIVGVLLFAAGFSYVLIARHTIGIVHRLAVASAIGTSLLLIWANLGVGLIGSGPNPANLLYIGVVGVVIIGTVLSRFTAKGMERTMYSTALALVIHTGIALLAGMQDYPGSSVGEILSVNGFFAVLFSVSGLLFRYAGKHEWHDDEAGV
jgi:hypothetical protein